MNNYPQARYGKIDRKIFEAVFSFTVHRLGTRRDFFNLTVDHFSEPLQTLISAEEAYEHISMRQYDLKQVAIKLKGRSNRFFKCHVPGLSEDHLTLIPNDRILVSDGSACFEMLINDIEEDRLILKNLSKNSIIQGHNYDISFVPSNVNYDIYSQALRDIKKDPRWQATLFGLSAVDKQSNPKIDFCGSRTKKLDDRLMHYNDRQKQAIVNILEAKCRPNLYILYGPPGTGKTYTLIEAVVQIYKRDNNVKILICAGSNNCVDGIAASLLQTHEIDSMVRLCSRFHYERCVRPDYFTIVPNKVDRYRVVVTTCMMASRLKIMGYDYVMVDEAGHINFAESLIPMNRLKEDGCIVLAGDPNQLGPVVKSQQVSQLGLGISLLERMFKLDLYARNNDSRYNERFITQLIESYRCDSRILELCNNLFYHGDLKCTIKTPPSILKILDCQKPLVFFKVQGSDMIPTYSTSRCNEIEAEACIQLLFALYELGLEPDQIGIITPYAMQKNILRQEFTKRLRLCASTLNSRFKLPTAIKLCRSGSEEVHLSAGCNPMNVTRAMDSLISALIDMKMIAESDGVRREDAPPIDSTLLQSPKMDWGCKIDTVDAFQGCEREVILVSSVRTSTSGPNTFFTDSKRFNVTVSRAKWLVVVVGHPAVLNCNYWKEYGKYSSQLDFEGLVASRSSSDGSKPQLSSKF